MDNKTTVTIVSAFGRGHWLAARLIKESIPVVLVDVSDKLGMWPVEDIEGPFGFFKNEKLHQTQLEALYSGDPFEELPNGFTLWLESGPFEFKGPTTKHKFSVSKVHPKIQELFNIGDFEQKAHEVLKDVRGLSFQETWILNFSQQYSSTTFVPNARALEVGESVPLHAIFEVRRISRQSHQKSLDWLEKQGVRVIQGQDVLDISTEGRSQVVGLELARESGGLLGFEKIVWCLSGEETYYLNKKIGQKIYAQGYLEPQWCWVRYRMSFAGCLERDRLPLNSAVVRDVYLPWTHNNLLVIQRTYSPDQFDVWLRLPNVQRFNKEYLRAQGFNAIETLTNKMSELKPEILNYPQEYYYTYAQLGPARYPIFAEADRKNRGHLGFKNTSVLGPEIWSNYTWNNYFSAEREVYVNLFVWWKEKLAREEKERKRREAKGENG